MAKSLSEVHPNLNMVDGARAHEMNDYKVITLRT